MPAKITPGNHTSACPAPVLLDRRPVLYAFTLAALGAHTSHAREGGLAWDASI